MAVHYYYLLRAVSSFTIQRQGMFLDKSSQKLTEISVFVKFLFLASYPCFCPERKDWPEVDTVSCFCTVNNRIVTGSPIKKLLFNSDI